jgi:hypothetical protein
MASLERDAKNISENLSAKTETGLAQAIVNLGDIARSNPQEFQQILAKVNKDVDTSFLTGGRGDLQITGFDSKSGRLVLNDSHTSQRILPDLSFSQAEKIIGRSSQNQSVGTDQYPHQRSDRVDYSDPNSVSHNRREVYPNENYGPILRDYHRPIVVPQEAQIVAQQSFENIVGPGAGTMNRMSDGSVMVLNADGSPKMRLEPSADGSTFVGFTDSQHTYKRLQNTVGGLSHTWEDETGMRYEMDIMMGRTGGLLDGSVRVLHKNAGENLARITTYTIDGAQLDGAILSNNKSELRRLITPDQQVFEFVAKPGTFAFRQDGQMWQAANGRSDVFVSEQGKQRNDVAFTPDGSGFGVQEYGKQTVYGVNGVKTYRMLSRN